MKRLFFINCLILIVINVMAYQPMVIEGYSWNVVHSGDGGIPTQRLYNTNKEIIKGVYIIVYD